MITAQLLYPRYFGSICVQREEVETCCPSLYTVCGLHQQAWSKLWDKTKHERSGQSLIFWCVEAVAAVMHLHSTLHKENHCTNTQNTCQYATTLWQPAQYIILSTTLITKCATLSLVPLPKSHTPPLIMKNKEGEQGEGVYFNKDTKSMQFNQSKLIKKKLYCETIKVHKQD